MIYNILKLIFGWAIRLYFRQIYVHFPTNWDPQQPTVFVSNHRNALIDAILIGSMIDRPIHFMSRGESFLHPFKRWLYDQFNMHPIYRMAHTPELCNRNLEQLSLFQQILRKHPLLIFPEGLSHCAPRLRPIQSGAARVILGAEASADYQLGIQVVPVGLNYSDAHTFRSEVFINFGAPIDLRDHLNLHQTKARVAIRQLSQAIGRAIDQQCLTIEDQQVEPLVRQCEALYNKTLIRQYHICPWESRQVFLVKKEVIRALHYYQKKYPAQVRKLNQNAQCYLQNLQRHQISDQLLEQIWQGQFPQQRHLTRLVHFLGRPLYWFGYWHHFPAIQTARFFAHQKGLRSDFRGSVLLSVSVLMILITYPLLGALFYYLSHSILATLFYLRAMMLSGYFAIHYAESKVVLQQQWTLEKLKQKQSDTIRRLLKQRQQLLEKLHLAQRLYLRQ
ncbi:MAG: 1-acyl-sn-glycerol-3-phosphate acyltransferase [Bacteroidota bacterium]